MKTTLIEKLKEIEEQEKKALPQSLVGIFSSLRKDVLKTVEEEIKSIAAEEAKRQVNEILGTLDTSVSTIVDNLKQAKGDKGDPGAPGYTPKKGVDYFDGKEGAPGIPGHPGKDGRTPIKGVDYFDGKKGTPGKDGSPDTGAEIVVKVNDLPIKPELQIDAKHIKNWPKEATWKKGGGRLGRGTSNPLQITDISSQLDGSNKTFTLPANKGVKLVISSSAPFWFIPTDYTVSGTDNTTLTFGSGVDASIMLNTGQQLGVLYIE